jgi:hypothetical protein
MLKSHTRHKSRQLVVPFFDPFHQSMDFVLSELMAHDGTVAHDAFVAGCPFFTITFLTFNNNLFPVLYFL